MHHMVVWRILMQLGSRRLLHGSGRRGIQFLLLFGSFIFRLLLHRGDLNLSLRFEHLQVEFRFLLIDIRCNIHLVGCCGGDLAVEPFGVFEVEAEHYSPK